MGGRVHYNIFDKRTFESLLAKRETSEKNAGKVKSGHFNKDESIATAET